MTNTKTLMLAAFAALSLGVGAANAQGLMPGGYQAPYLGAPTRTAPARVNRGIDAGSSDIFQMHSRAIHSTPVPLGVPGGGNG